MKKNRKESREFNKLKEQLKSIKEIVYYTKVANLWSHEAAIRKKLKALNEMDTPSLKESEKLAREYRELLDEISKRLLADYNIKNQGDYQFEAIVGENLEAYLSSGIMAVLIAHHIPKQMISLLEHYLPENPKDEYQEARGMKRKVYIHLGETNTGKTYQAIEKLKQSTSGIYLAPLRILALEIFERLNNEGISCNLLTGEEQSIVEGARHESATIEKLNLEKNYEVAVIDEIQMIGDAQRGAAWTRALLGLRCQEIHVCGAMNAKEILMEILEDCGDEVEIKEYVRNIPLQVEEQPFSLKQAQKGDALIVFSKKRVLELAKQYKQAGVKTSLIYGDLPPEVRKMQYHDFIEGVSKVLVSTDAIGMGVNLPIRRILFLNLKKFDGEEVRFLTSQEVKQIAGRAGRKGIYEVGYVGATGQHYTFIKEQIEKVDEPVAWAVRGPSEVLLQIKGLPLKEKLVLWHTREEEISLYRKMEISDYLFILDRIKKYKLPEEVEWKLMKLPFDVHNENVLSYFLEQIHTCFVMKKSLTKPSQGELTLENLESYYQKVNVYYSFAKNLQMELDEEWVYEKRGEISERINELLLKI